MNKKYQDWIEKNVPKECQGSCLHYAKMMKADFSELEIFGQADIFAQGHYWCVSPDGAVVDPTISQFDGRTPDYSRCLHEDFFVGSRKCHWCGEAVWPDSPELRKHLNLGPEEMGPHTFCSEQFALAYNTTND